MNDIQHQKLDPIHRQSAIVRLSPPVGPQVEYFDGVIGLSSPKQIETLIASMSDQIDDIERLFRRSEFDAIIPMADHIGQLAEKMRLPEIAYVADHLRLCSQTMDATALGAVIARCARLIARARDELEHQLP